MLNLKRREEKLFLNNKMRCTGIPCQCRSTRYDICTTFFLTAERQCFMFLLFGGCCCCCCCCCLSSDNKRFVRGVTRPCFKLLLFFCFDNPARVLSLKRRTYCHFPSAVSLICYTVGYVLYYLKLKILTSKSIFFVLSAV